MKGPIVRLDMDVRRLWECPQCGRQRKASGNVVTQRCTCTKDGNWMRLVEEQRQVRTFSHVTAAPTIEPETPTSPSDAPSSPPDAPSSTPETENPPAPNGSPKDETATPEESPESEPADESTESNK